jgi:transcriptional regulator with XRE-family HTH domain
MPRALKPISRISQQALTLLGQSIQLARKRARMSEGLLAEKVGIARSTLQKIERGEPSVLIGTAFEAAVILGVPLFNMDRSPLAARISENAGILTLLPDAPRGPKEPIDDNF